MPETGLIPFGKYKGQPVEVLAADRNYCDWLAGQPWFRERYRNVYNVVVNLHGEPQDTPEHNALQARFLDDEFCLALWRLIRPDKAEIEANLLGELEAECRLWLNKEINCDLKHKEDYVSPSQKSDWNSPNHANRYNEAKHWLEDAKTFLHDGSFWLDDLTVKPAYVRRRVFEIGGFDVLFEVDFFATCFPRLGNGIIRSKHKVEVGGHAGFAIECKPFIGDDYPSVIRQVLNARVSRADQSRMKVVVTGAYTGIGASLEQVRAIYASSDVNLVLVNEIIPPQTNCPF